MDWKDILASKVQAGELSREDSTPEPEQPKDHKTTDILEVVTDRKGRKGKTATIVCGFSLPDDQLADVASDLRRSLGVGGSSRAGEILLQGDVAAKARQLLKAKGYKVKG